MIDIARPTSSLQAKDDIVRALGVSSTTMSSKVDIANVPAASL